MSNVENTVSTLKCSMVSAALGLVVGLTQGLILPMNMTDVLEVFPRESGAPGIIRHHRTSARDTIYIAPSKSGMILTNQYMSLDAYLRTIENKYERAIQKAQIKKQVNW